MEEKKRLYELKEGLGWLLNKMTRSGTGFASLLRAVFGPMKPLIEDLIVNLNSLMRFFEEREKEE